MPKTRPPELHRRRWTIADARLVLDALGSSGLSMKDFAEREGLELNRLYRWQRRLTDEPQRQMGRATPELLEIRARPAETIEIVLGSGLILRVAATIDATVLARLIAVLGRTEGC